ncbi:MAG: YceI family protein [Alphaproteobacteria bacterium]
MQATSGQGFGGIARLLHWLTVFLIIALYALGWYMADLELTDPDKFRLYQIHKSIGITVLVLAVLRLLWRLTYEAPAWPAHMAPWERLAAAGAHWALYGLLLLQPLLGVLQSNAANFPIVFWGGYELPALIGPNETVAKILLNLHHLLANVLAVLVLLHVAAALRHHIQLKDDVLRNMMPSAGLGGAAVALALVLIAPPFILTERTEQPVAAAGGEAAETAAPAAVAAPAVVADAERSEDVPAADAWAVLDGSELGFVARQQGSDVTGSFGSFDAEIVFDPNDLEASRISVDIDVTSITTGHSDRDKTLNSASFFDTATWPSAAFKSDRITAAGEGTSEAAATYEAVGTLTMRDVTMEVVLPFSLTIEDDPNDSKTSLAQAKGELPIRRLDYGIGQGDWASTVTVADEVVITIDIKASKPKG